MRLKTINPEVLLRKSKDIGNSICFTSGCFDLFHPGHVYFLSRCRCLTTSQNLLVVGLNSDESILKWKDRGPICHQGGRVIMLSLHPEVDYIVLFDERNPKSLIDLLRPKMIFHGHSIDRPAWTGTSISELDGFEGDVIKIPIEGEWSTTNLKRKAATSYAKQSASC